MTRSDFLTLDFAWDIESDPPQGVWSDDNKLCVEACVWHARAEDVADGNADSDQAGGYHLAAPLLDWDLSGYSNVAVITEAGDILRGRSVLVYLAKRNPHCYPEDVRLRFLLWLWHASEAGVGSLALYDAYRDAGPTGLLGFVDALVDADLWHRSSATQGNITEAGVVALRNAGLLAAPRTAEAEHFTEQVIAEHFEPETEEAGLRHADYEAIGRVWMGIFGRGPLVEAMEHTPGPEECGPEVTINNTIAVWPCMMMWTPLATIANPKPEAREVPGWRVAVLVPEYNYPHAPDDVDYAQESEHRDFSAALAQACMLWTEISLRGHFDAIADEAFAEQAEATS